ncbi:MAG TPA: bifunctional [glutamine synthetase] adenylyltransferase/[glutamine synthetase]-adenylyl-L-tyrosine phosphorylase [Stellaceae bacterium]|jgi:glutamate-ammonia-ligase adenylyltransferase|nr:bifunctional [glutamine synthetase] adenylyltransferase/[glutamine synthetase]-adenylyl-L-tyrosine phosphorylase [Stellaceae bacterium]
MKLLSQLSPDGGPLPLPADARRLEIGLAAWNEALDAAEDHQAAARARTWSASPAGRKLLAAIFGNSPFLSGVAVAEWDFLSRLVEHGADPLFGDILGTTLAHNHGENRAETMRRLRVAKRRTALVAAVAELAGAWTLERQMAALSGFAEAALRAALRHLFREAAEAGTMTLADPGDPERDCGFFILAMGKLGAGELNYSSDIDLILLFDPVRAALKDRDGAQIFFTRLARDLVRIVDERTGDGYVFRTDLRLRPDPRSTPLAMSVAAAMAYYESVGQNWERAAMIKARAIAGDVPAGERFLAELAPFIWRKSLDFAALSDIHSIKRQIDAHRGGGRIAIEGHDVKLGRGGIREVEFFAQTQQLIWGGRIPALRLRETVPALHALAAAGRIDRAAAERLATDYRFLRRVEHRLQMIDDAQTHRLPTDRDGLAHLALFLGYDGVEAFAGDLRNTLVSVERHYADLFEEAPSLAGPGNLVFTGADDDPGTLATLSRLGFANPSQVATTVRDWHHGRIRATRSERAREILTELVPELLRIFGATAAPDTALTRFDRFLSHLPAGVQLFSLFKQNPGLLTLVADTMAEAPQLADNLVRRPALLDAVLTTEFSAPLPDRAGLAADLAAMREGSRDFEATLDLLRRWSNERRFQVGVQLLRRGLDGARAGAALADIAETVLAALAPAVADDFARQHGRIAGGAFAVIGMGRLGSREMSLSSDLDLIMVYDAPAATEMSDGPRPLAPSTYFARLGQRLIGAITAPTAEGRLYEVDMRLRPSGESGPIATRIDAFAHYQRDEAWTWEHMALTRARPVAGNASLFAAVEAAIADALRRPRDRRTLVADVADMRRRIAGQHLHPSPWDLRNRRGGLVDIEFIVQHLILRDAPQIAPRGIAPAIDALGEAGALTPRAAQELGEAVRLLRHVQALLALLFEGPPDPDALTGMHAATLARCAGAVDFARLDAEISEACARGREWYDRLVARPARRAAKRAAIATGEALR